MAGGDSPDQVPEMLQALLAERFKLAIHRYNRELPVYALVVGRNGPKLQEAAPDAAVAAPAPSGARPLYTPQGEARTLEDGSFMVTASPFGPIRGGLGPNGMKVEFLKVTMPALAEVLTPHADRPVVDMTSRKGPYRLTSETRAPSGEGGGRKGGPESAGDRVEPGLRSDPFGEALFTAIEKAGLKLEARKAPVEVIVVDRLEKTAAAN
jgi:uncharacterized protein (TIGR03435 family)